MSPRPVNSPDAGSRIVVGGESRLASGLRAFLNATATKIALAAISSAALLWCAWNAISTITAGISEIRGNNALHEAHALSRAERFPDAAAAYTRALEHKIRGTERAAAYLGRGWSYMNLERYVDAISDFDAALAINPNLVMARLNRGLTFHRRGEFAAAHADYDRTIALDPNQVDAYRNRALILAHDGRLKEAIADMDEAIRCAPNDPRWFVRRGSFQRLDGNLQGALASFEAALRLDPANPEAHYGRAHVRIAANDTPRALAELNEAVKSLPNAAGVRIARAWIQFEQNMLDEAVEDAAEAVRLAPKVAGGYGIRGLVEFAFGSLDAAKAFADMALQLAPRFPLAHQLQGRVHDARGEFGDAIAAFERAIACDSEYVPPVVWRGITFAHAGSYERARQELKEAVRRFPGVADSRLMLAWFLATCPDAAFRDGAAAVAEAELGVELSRGSADALDVLAAATAEVGDFGRALELQIQAIDKTPARSADCVRRQYRAFEYWNRTPHREVRTTGQAEPDN